MTTFLCLLVSTLPTEPLIAPELAPTEPSVASYSAYEPAFGAFTPALEPDDFPELEYTFIEANYVMTDSDVVNDDIDGWELTGSLELPLNFFLQGTASMLSADEDVTSYRLGAGWHLGFLKRFDAYGLLSYAHLEVDDSTNDFSEDGAAAELGLRMLVIKSLEVNARALWVDIEDEDTGGGVGARFYLSDSLSLGARYDKLGDDETIAAGARFEF